MLLVGPPGSGKTHRVLEAVRDRLRNGQAGFRLIVPTATMAEHVRNTLAREGFVFHPSAISTLAHFVEPWVRDRQPLSGARLDGLIGDALRSLAPEAFRAVAELAGFRAAIAKTIEELSSAGYPAGQLRSVLGAQAGPVADGLLSIYEEIARRTAELGLALRGERLQLAAARIREQAPAGFDEIFFDGFFSFVDPELEIIEALHRSARITLTLPDWEGAEVSRSRLRSMGIEEERCERIGQRPAMVLIKAQTQDREVEEIAARIVELVGRGSAFRDFGVVVRQSDPYVPALRATLERFGIPARYYFSEPLEGHSLVRYYAALIEATLTGWDHERTLEALRMTPGAVDADRFDFDVRAQLPGIGLDGLRMLTRDPQLRARIESLEALDRWRTSPAAPAEWGERFGTLANLFEAPAPLEPASHDMVAMWRGTVTAMQAFDEAVAETVSSLASEKLTLDEFWGGLKNALRLATIEVPDHRRNVVHVMEVHEARQWELPVVFVCGLLEKQFPLHHSQDAFLTDDLRRTLQRRGMRLATTAERDREEKFLFELATTRATQTLVLSYPQFNPKGEETLRSFCLDRFVEAAEGLSEQPARAVRPQARGPRTPERRAILVDEVLRQSVARAHAHTNPTAIEVFLQCPFRFFAERTLRLQSPPPAPADRLDARVQGILVHEVLKRWLRTQCPVGEVFEDAFPEICRRERIVERYRTEAIRLELLRNLLRFAGTLRLDGLCPEAAEQDYTLPLAEELTLGCRVDRIDVAPDGKVVVIDYKYSSPPSVAKLVKGHAEGLRIQGGIYMRALVHQGRECAGMLFAGLRNQPAWDGWQTVQERIGRSEQCTAEDLLAVMERAKETALIAIASIGQGVIEPKPAEASLCEHCDFHDICRVETAVQVAVAGEVEEWA
jgi:ATP-dependent helicase/DNAse subunit B